MKEALFIKMVLDAWYAQIKNGDDLLNALSDEQLMKEVSPGRNRGIYLLGHLVSVHDRMLPLLGFGDQLHPELYKPFVESPDKAATGLPSIADLRFYWKEVNSRLSDNFSRLSPDEWFQRHNSVTEADFEKERHRNKLNIIISRTNHLANHLGQVVFLKG